MEHSPMSLDARSGSRSTVRGVLVASASCALACLAGCASSNPTAHASQGTSGPSASAAQTGGLAQASPFFLPASTFRAPTGALPRLASVPSATASLPWLLVARDQVSGKLTIEVVRGGCAEAAEGYVASGTPIEVVLTVIAGIQHTQACEATRTYSLYTLTLPTSDANKTLEHGTIHDWQ
jgi:hypothetical protein